MDSESRAFEASFEDGLAAGETQILSSIGTEMGAGVPLRCHRPMRAQPVVVATPVSLIGSAISAVLAVPRTAFLAPELLGARTQRRA